MKVKKDSFSKGDNTPLGLTESHLRSPQLWDTYEHWILLLN